MSGDRARGTLADILVTDSVRILDATRLAWAWHGRQTRKGRATSYMSHLLQVQGLVIRAGGDPDQAIAALLHDSLEDAPDPGERARREDEIGDRFGSRVLSIVLDCTDTTRDEAGDAKGPWRRRKERSLRQLRNAPPASRLVAACDKRQNLGDLVADLRHEGASTLGRFNAGPAEQIWYFGSLLEICRSDIPGALADELDSLLEAFTTLSGLERR